MMAFHEYREMNAAQLAFCDTVTRTELDEAARNLREQIESGVTSLLVLVGEVEGGRASVFWNDICLALAALDENCRCAVVTSENERIWLESSGKALAHCETRYFNHDQTALARGWLLSRPAYAESVAA